jgi:hypothetical protein
MMVAGVRIASWQLATTATRALPRTELEGGAVDVDPGAVPEDTCVDAPQPVTASSTTVANAARPGKVLRLKHLNTASSTLTAVRAGDLEGSTSLAITTMCLARAHIAVHGGSHN